MFQMLCNSYILLVIGTSILLAYELWLTLCIIHKYTNTITNTNSPALLTHTYTQTPKNYKTLSILEDSPRRQRASLTLIMTSRFLHCLASETDIYVLQIN